MILDNFTEEMIEHLKKHPELLEQRQGRDIVQNFFVINPQKTQLSFKDALDNLKKRNQKILEELTAPRSIKFMSEEILTIENILQYFGDESKSLEHSGLDIKNMRQEIIKQASLVKESLEILVKTYEKDIKIDDRQKKELQPYIDEANHILLDFNILLKITFPAGTAYLRNLKKELKKSKTNDEIKQMLEKIQYD